MEELVEDVIAEGLGFRESCNRIIYLLFEYTESKPNIIAFVLHAKHQEFLPEEPPICSSTPFKTMRNIVQQDIDSGEIRLIHLRLDGVLEHSLPNLYDELIDTMWHGLLPTTLSETVL
jgi:hypothetical protein